MKRKIFSALFALVLVLSFSLIPAMPAMAATIDVPGDHATIQAAIDAASDGDTISVAAGTYTEDLAIDGKNLTLVGAGSGADPASNTILRKIDTYASNLEVENAISLTVSGFRFIGGMYGIEAYDDPITVNIHDNVFAFINQSGVHVGNGQSGSLAQNNEFIGCGGVEFWNCTGGTISGNSVSNDGVGTFLMGCDGTTVSGNEVTVFGRGLRINSPPGISGDYPAGYALFGPLSWTDITGDVVYAEPALADVPLTNPEEIIGNIALIDRGEVSFAIKVKNAQDAGAVGVIIANNEDELINMAGDDASITIPAISVKLSDGDAIKAELAAGVNATLSSTPYGAVIADEGIHIQSCNNITVTGNTVSKFKNGEYPMYSHGRAGAGIGITGGCDTLTITNNNLTDNSVGVYIGATATSSSPTNVEINENNIEDNADYGVLNIKYPESGDWNSWDYHLFGAADATVDATNNYWNHATGADHADNPHGTGKGGDAVSDNVDFSPWYATSTTTSSTQYVSVDHPGSSIIAYSDTIQGGIDAALSGDTINVAAGTYNEHITIDKSLTLQPNSIPIIDGGGTGTAITIDASNVAITEFTIQNADTGVLVSSGTGNALHLNNIINNTTWGLNNTGGSSVDATNNWWGSGGDGEPGQDGNNSVSANVTYDPWIGKTGTNSDHEDIDTDGGTLDLTGGGGGSSVDVDMDAGSAGFNAVEETGEPTQGFTGMGSGGGIDKSIVITTDADDGDFIMCVKFHYTDAELGALSENDLRLCYWDTDDEEWKLAVEGNTDLVADPPVWLGNASPPESDLADHLGEHGVDQVNNIAWAVVDHCTEYGAGEEPPGEGSFEVSPPSVTVTFEPTSMTPMHEQTVTVGVEVDSTLTLADLTSLTFKVWYDSDGGTPSLIDTPPENGIPDEFEGKTGATQTCAVITWDGSDTFSIDSQAVGETTTTWELGTCSKPTDMGVTSGNFTLKFTPGKVATEADGTSDNWQLAASVASTHGGNGFGYDADASSMDWYGCMVLSDTITVDWGVVPAGMDFDNDLADQTLGATITIISNGAYDLKAKAGDWTGPGTPPTNTATLDWAEPLCDSAQEFALKADIDADIDGADVLDTSGVVITSGSITTEDGAAYDSTLWLKLANTFAEDTYSGLITYMIATMSD